ncbi:MAG TPA: DUF899 family protein, partial [Gammaproteobacteria bacterium]|nr:DUF899 family protein [Gammaproteobacteria bacterium]
MATKARKKKAVSRKKTIRRKKRPARRAKAKRPKGYTSRVRFSGETPAYRKARDKLLEAERDLRRQTEAVAALRRKLPLGGELKEDYLFEESDKNGGSKPVRFSELFAPGKDTLVLYNFMFGPAMARACPSCTTMLDALDGNAKAIGQRVNLAVVAKSPLPRILSH